jgi:hypothetical protein
MLFREIITVYSENHKKPVNILFGNNTELLNVEACDRPYHWVINGQ